MAAKLDFEDSKIQWMMANLGLSPIQLLEHYIEHAPDKNIRDAATHKQTLDAILDAKKLPNEDAIRDMIFYSAVIKETNPAHHKVLFGKRSILGNWTDIGTVGGLVDDAIMQAWTVECIHALRDAILGLGVKGPIYEIGAGRGELSYHLNQVGIPIIATDTNPRSDFVKKRNARMVLQNNPEFVLTCWAYNKGMIDEIIASKDIKYFLEISDNDHPFTKERKRDYPGWKVTTLSEVQKHYIPLDLFCASKQTGEGDKDLQYASALVQFKFDTPKYLGKNDLIFLWTRK